MKTNARHTFQIFICKIFWKQCIIFFLLHNYALFCVCVLVYHIKSQWNTFKFVVVMWQNVVLSPSYFPTYLLGTGNRRIFLRELKTKRWHRNAHCNYWNYMTYNDTLSHYFWTDYLKQTASECGKHNKLTCDWGAGRPRRDGVSPLIEEDVGATCTHLRLWNSLSTTVIITVPLTIHRVPAEGCNHNNYL